LSRIVNIFVVQENSLYSVQYEDEELDSLAQLFDNWSNTEYLHDYFEKHKDKLESDFYNNMSIKSAVLKTISESERFEDLLNESIENGIVLDGLKFKNLSKGETSSNLISSKAYGPSGKSWLRVYAICLSSKTFFITGGGIKLTKEMSEMEELEKELKKINQVRDFLKENFVFEDSDIGVFEIDNDRLIL